MYRIRNTKSGALAHSTYIRRDRKQVMTFCAQLAEMEGQTLSRFITDILLDYLEGNLVYRQELAKKIRARRPKK